jgi:hypothetical protein
VNLIVALCRGILPEKYAQGRNVPSPSYWDNTPQHVARRVLLPKEFSAECNYEIHDKEFLTIICCLKEWESEHRRNSAITANYQNLLYFAARGGRRESLLFHPRI